MYASASCFWWFPGEPCSVITPLILNSLSFMIPIWVKRFWKAFKDPPFWIHIHYWGNWGIEGFHPAHSLNLVLVFKRSGSDLHWNCGPVVNKLQRESHKEPVYYWKDGFLQPSLKNAAARIETFPWNRIINSELLLCFLVYNLLVTLGVIVI